MEHPIVTALRAHVLKREAEYEAVARTPYADESEERWLEEARECLRIAVQADAEAKP